MIPALLDWKQDPERAKRYIVLYERYILIIPLVLAVTVPVFISFY